MQTDTKTFTDTMFDLVDEGLIIMMMDSTTSKAIALASACVSLQVQAIRESTSSTTKLTWLEAAALKMPEGIFHEIAESVAMRFIRQSWKTVFPDTLFSTMGPLPENSSTLDFGVGIAPSGLSTCTYSINDSPNLIVNMLHKEMNSNGAADVVMLYAQDQSNMKLIHLIRIQLKLGQGTFSKDEVLALEIDMKTRGVEILTAVTNAQYQIQSYTNFLFTTKYCEVDFTELAKFQFKSNVPPQDPVFFLVDSRQISLCWPNEVKKALGLPNAFNQNINVGNVTS